MSLNNHCILVILNLFISIYCNEENPSILVIGSGPSGIAAATKLWKHNFTNLKILEAEDRIGGRIRSIKFGDAYVDLGAQHYIGGEDHVIYKMMKQYNILKETNISIKIMYSNGEFIDENMTRNLREIGDSVGSRDIAVNCNNISLLTECFTKELEANFQKSYAADPDKLKIAWDSVDFLESYVLGDESSLTLSDVSIKSAYKDSGDYLNWNGLGFKTLLEVMLQQYPDPSKSLPLVNNILLQKEVIKIIWSNGTAKNSLKCSDGTVYEADHVIFTASLGVLKIVHDKVFEPKLPDEKVTAIKNIGFGVIMKIMFHFNTTWWDQKVIYTFIWSAEDKKKIATEFGKGPVKNGRSWLTTSAGFITADHNPKVLIFFFAGDMLPEMEKESDEVLQDGCMYLFRKFMGNKYSIVEPNKMIKSTWYSNPHFYGTYSYESVNAEGHPFREELASPLSRKNGSPSILFAGEATNPYSFGTVHGAVETGYREADRIIDLYQHK